MRCEGKCEGKCTGTCNGSTTDGAACDGKCEGECDATCTIEGSAKCEGTCSGSCSITPPDGHCEGSCKGSCKVEGQAGVACEGGEMPSCTGTCEASCSGSCDGSVTPPSCEVEGGCEAAADCEASASAEANASLECSPPSLEIAYALKANLGGSAEANAIAAANFKAKMEIFKKAMVNIAQGAFKLKGLVQGNGTVEPPVVAIGTQMKKVGTALLNGSLNIDIPVFRLNCAGSAVDEAAGALVGIKNDVSATVQGQLSMLSIIKIEP